jgi:hypothetical protein
MQTWQSSMVSTERLDTHVWTAGPEDGVPLLLVHGNLVTGGWWRYVAAALPDDVRVVEIEPGQEGWGEGFSDAIERRLPEVVEAVWSSATP